MTYSIVARDPDTGELGVAVQSHWFSVGSLVTWARPGIGAVATQANVDFFDELGSPGGASKVGVVNDDPPMVVELPPQGEE